MKKAKISLRERSPFGARLYLCRTFARLTQEQVGALVGIAQGTLNESEKKAGSSRSTAQLAQIYGVDAHWLATGYGTPPNWWHLCLDNEGNLKEPPKQGGVLDAEPVPKTLHLTYAGHPTNTQRVLVIGTAKIDSAGAYLELDHNNGSGDGFVEHYSSDKSAYGVRVRGDGLHPVIRHGEVLIIEPEGALVAGERVLICLRTGTKIVADLVVGRPDSVTVTGPTSGVRQTYLRGEIEWIHAIVAIIASSKWHPQ